MFYFLMHQHFLKMGLIIIYLIHIRYYTFVVENSHGIKDKRYNINICIDLIENKLFEPVVFPSHLIYWKTFYRRSSCY